MFDLSPGAGGDAPAGEFEALDALAFALEGRRRVMEFMAVGFDDEAGIAPEEVSLQG